MSTVPTPKRGEIWLVDFDPAVGAEIRKVRPAVVVSLDSAGRLPLRIIVPLTDWKAQYATYTWFTLIRTTAISGLTKDSGADAFQVKSVSQDRFVQRLGSLTSTELDLVATAVSMVVGKP
jgi:mRNA interferase MazF